MTLQNRVDPFGHIHAIADRGLFMGNRGGCFHRDDKTLKPTHWRTRQWIYCVLEFKGRKRELMSPGKYTELFFLDEATALAAGHRPCYECQRQKALAFREALMDSGILTERPKVSDLNDRIAGEIQSRLKSGTQGPLVSPADLPDGAMYEIGGDPYLVLGGEAVPWHFAGYDRALSLHKAGRALTPAVTRAALKAGFSPVIHPTATA